MQCPALQPERDKFFLDLGNISDESSIIVLNMENYVLAILLGKIVNGLTLQQMENVWFVIANGVCRMYKRNLRLKEGVN